MNSTIKVILLALAGIAGGTVLVIGGVALSLTIIGALIGIPMALIGLVLPVALPLKYVLGRRKR